MISYQIYKLIHLGSLFALMIFMTFTLLQEKSRKEKSSKWNAAAIGILGLLVMTGGMGLMARKYGEFQPWIIAKIVLWFILMGGGHLAAKRFAHYGKVVLLLIWCLVTIAAYLAIYRPF